ncbi:DUF4116 domain-containing protein [Clostridioides difficile]
MNKDKRILNNIKTHLSNFKLDRNQRYEDYLEIVKRDGMKIKHLSMLLSKDQVNKIYIEAVKQNGMALEYIKLYT